MKKVEEIEKQAEALIASISKKTRKAFPEKTDDEILDFVIIVLRKARELREQKSKL